MKYGGWIYYEFYDGSGGVISFIEGQLGYNMALAKIRELSSKKKTFISHLEIR